MYQARGCCLTCFQKDGSGEMLSLNDPGIQEAVRKHFWFKGTDLAEAAVCAVCWDNIESFHRFYITVLKLYETRREPPLENVTVKVENLDIMLVDEEPEIKEEVQSDLDETDMLLLEEEDTHSKEHLEGETLKEEFDDETADESVDLSPEQMTDEEDPDQIIRRHIMLNCSECTQENLSFKQFFVHALKVHQTKLTSVSCCGNKYHTRSRLLEHVRYVLDPQAFKCKRCKQMFTNSDSLKRHLKVHHGIEGRTRAYNSSNRLKKDKTPAEKSEEQLQKEEGIEKKRQDRRAEDQLMLEHVKFECVPCGESFSTFAELFSHCRTEHKRRPVVICCGNRFHSRPRLLQHVQSVKNPVAFRCELCFRCFQSDYARTKHVSEMHATEEELKFKCDRCPKAFIRESQWKKHLKDHEDSDSGKIKCDQCGKMFKSYHILYMHVRKKHQEPQFVCDICAKAFHLQSEFKQHKLQHEDPEQLKMQCQHCLKWFKNREYWRAHVRLHVVGEVKCELCGRVTPNRRAFRAHMKNAHGNRSKKCDWCGKGFNKEITLREHIASRHTGDMLYTCAFCPKTFNSNANMHSHKKKMHYEEWMAMKESAATAAMPSFATQ